MLPVFNDDAEVLAQAWQVMLYMVPLYFTWTYIEIISGVLRGIGDAVVPVIIIGVGVCLLRVVWIATVYRAAPHHAQRMPRVSNILDSDGRSFLLLLPQGKVAVPH